MISAAPVTGSGGSMPPGGLTVKVMRMDKPLPNTMPDASEAPRRTARAVAAAFEGNRKYATPRQIAKLLEVGEDKVLGWIKTGILPAEDHRGVQSQRPRWKISRDHIDAFKRQRTRAASHDAENRIQRASRRTATVRDWFPED
jgi:hypothetical protein